MATNDVGMPLIAIVGPTSSGKTGLAISLASQFGGEIISADSRAVYRGLDIGTAKPALLERQGVPHWGFDLVDPGERFTAADFKKYALEKIADIRARGRVPFLVGGTGLYIDSVLYDFQFSATSNDPIARRRFEQMSLESLYIYCRENNILLPENHKNKRYVINSILRGNNKQIRNSTIMNNSVLVGILVDKSLLRKRIKRRTKTIVSDTTIAEARLAAEQWGWDNEAMTGNVYPLIRRYLEGDISRLDLERKSCTLDWRLAKRQLTWFKCNQDIRWLELDEAYRYIAQQLAAAG